MFNFDYTTPTATSTPTHIDDGTYDGTIEFTEVKPSQAGHRYVNLKIKLGNGAAIRENLNLEHPNGDVKRIAQEKAQAIIAYGINQPEAKFTTIESLASYLKGTPVRVFYKNKGTDEKGYAKYSLTFKPIEQDRKAVKSTASATKTSVY